MPATAPSVAPVACVRHFRIARPSDYIDELAAIHAADPRPVVLLLRVSSEGQAANLDDQENEALRELAVIGVPVLAIIRGVEDSRIHADRPLLFEALAVARANGARVVTASRDRLIRYVCYDGRNKRDCPTNGEFNLLKWFARDVPLATILHPDRAARSKQIIRGQTAKQNAGGRPRKIRAKERRQDRIEQARQLRASGLSLRAIANRLNELSDGHAPVTHNTIRNWLCKFSDATAGESNPNPKETGVCSVDEPPQPATETITVNPVPGTLPANDQSSNESANPEFPSSDPEPDLPSFQPEPTMTQSPNTGTGPPYKGQPP